MFFVRDTYATVWKVQEVRENYTRVRLSTSEKDLSGNYINSTWFPMFTGKAHEKAHSLKERDRIIIKTGKVNNKRQQKDDGSWVTYYNVYVFDFEFSDSANQGETHPPKVKETDDFQEEPEEDDVMPF